MSVAVRGSRSEAAGLLALQEVHAEPGIRQSDLADRLRAATGLANSTLQRVLRRLETEGHLESSRNGPNKTYRPANGVTRGPRGQLVAVAMAIFVAAAGVAFFLAPDKHNTPASDLPSAEAPAPPPPPASHPKPRHAKPRLEVATLSATSSPGIAGTTADRLKRSGFHVRTVGNAPATAAQSVVYYRRGAESAAKALAGKLHIRHVSHVGAKTQAAAPSARLLVVLGSDRAR